MRKNTKQEFYKNIQKMELIEKANKTRMCDPSVRKWERMQKMVSMTLRLNAFFVRCDERILIYKNKPFRFLILLPVEFVLVQIEIRFHVILFAFII